MGRVNFDKYRKVLRDDSDDMQIPVFCQCGAVHNTQWDNALAIHDLRYGTPPVELYTVAELEQKCCPDIATPEGVEFYCVDEEYALAYSDVNEPILLTTFTCSQCREKHLVLFDGRHRLYKAVMEEIVYIPAYMFDEDEYKGFTCIVEGVTA